MQGFNFSVCAASSPLSTPYLITSEGQKLHDSTHIMQYINGRYSSKETDLYAHPEAAAMELGLSERMGPGIRRIAYWYLLQEEPLFFKTCAGNVGPWSFQYLLFRALWPLLRTRLRRALSINAERVAKSKGQIMAEFDLVAERLTQSSPGDPSNGFIVGSAFSAADLAFASMAVPLLGITSVDGFGGYLPDVLSLSGPGVSANLAEFQGLVRQLRTHPAGQHALRMYREFRHPERRAISGLPLLPLPKGSPSSASASGGGNRASSSREVDRDPLLARDSSRTTAKL
jgi:glutathione S-transferase